MGINVINKTVLYDSSHNKLLNTSIHYNPTTNNIGGVNVHSIYKRRQNTNKTKKGDGNPAIYALKNINGYSIQATELKKFLPSYYRIITQVLSSKNFDLILYLPSSYNIGSEIAKHSKRILSSPNIEHNFFAKNTIQQAINMINFANVPKSDIRDLHREIGKLNKSPNNHSLSMKVINYNYRKYFQPIRINNHNMNGNNILIIDDLLASGTSMECAINLVRSMNTNAHIEGLCLFSPL